MMRIVVLGMHRSGTSVLTRMLAMMGCHIGGDGDFNPAAPDNPTGFWERRDVWALNEEILSSLGASWSDVGELDLQRLDAGRRATFEARAQEIVSALEPHRPWVIKDPRLCLLLPVWLPALGRPLCLMPHRRPIQVAQSLQARDGIPLVVGLALWEKYTCEALRHSAGLPRIGVSHARMNADPGMALHELAQQMERAGVKGLSVPSADQIRGFIDPELVHARRTLEDEMPLMTVRQQELARRIEDGCIFELPAPQPVPREIDELISGYFGLETRARDSEAATDRARELRDEKAARVEELATQLEQSEVAMQHTVEARDANAARVEEIAGQLETVERNLVSSEARLEATQTELSTIKSKLDEAREVQAELDHNLATSTQRAEMLDSRIEALESELEGALRKTQSVAQELSHGLTHAAELQALLDLVLGSRRFRFATQAGELARRLTLRAKQPAASEHRDRIVRNVDDWRRRLERDYRVPTRD